MNNEQLPSDSERRWNEIDALEEQIKVKIETFNYMINELKIRKRLIDNHLNRNIPSVLKRYADHLNSLKQEKISLAVNNDLIAEEEETDRMLLEVANLHESMYPDDYKQTHLTETITIDSDDD